MIYFNSSRSNIKATVPTFPKLIPGTHIVKYQISVSILFNSVVVIFFFQKSLSRSTSRRSSLTESISAALDSFDFLKEESESNNSYPSTPTSSLPSQWSIGSRPLFHHLYMVYDLVYDYKIPQGPLIEREKTVIGKLQENLSALTELCLVINSYERLQVANGELNDISTLL